MAEIGPVLYYLMQTVISSRNLYDPVFLETHKWRNATVTECNEPRARRYLQKVAALAQAYLKTFDALAIDLVVYNQEAEPQEKWSFRCRSGAQFDAKSFQAAVNQIVAAAGYLAPLNESSSFKVLATVPNDLELDRFCLRPSQGVAVRGPEIAITPTQGVAAKYSAVA